MNAPVCTKKAPYIIEAEEGKTYFYCTCGRSENQPFCDGKHKGSGFTPTRYTAEKTGNVYFCGCRASKRGALCDGEHKNL